MMQNGRVEGNHVNAHRPDLDSIRTLMLTEAIKSGNLDGVIQILTDHNVNINNRLDGSWPPFLLASFHCQFDIMVHFLHLGADPLFAANFFNSLMAACSSSNPSEEAVLRCVRFLVNQGLPINERDSSRTTALMMASRNGHKDVITELLSRGAVIDMQDYEGWSALFHAVSQNHVEIVKLLIDNGASVRLEDRRGRKVIDIAEVKGLTDIVSLISKDEKPEDAIEVEPEVPINLAVRSFRDMVCELPDNNAFMVDVLNFLHHLNLNRYSRTFYDKKVNLGELLLMDEDELKEVGVYFSYHRNLILNATRRFHLSTWKNCFGIKKNSKLQSDEIAFFLANITRHLYTLAQSTKFIKKHWDKEGIKVCNNEFKSIILKNIDQLNFIEKKLQRFRDFGIKLEKYDRLTYVDLINEKTLNTKNRVMSKFFMVYLPSAVFCLVFMKYKNLVPVFLKFFLNKAPLPKSYKFW